MFFSMARWMRCSYSASSWKFRSWRGGEKTDLSGEAVTTGSMPSKVDRRRSRCPGCSKPSFGEWRPDCVDVESHDEEPTEILPPCGLSREQLLHPPSLLEQVQCLRVWKLSAGKSQSVSERRALYDFIRPFVVPGNFHPHGKVRSVFQQQVRHC